MQLTYTLTFEDWLEFTLDTHQRVPSMRRMKKFSHYAIGAVYAAFGVIVIAFQDELVFGISFLMLSLAWFILFPKYHKRRTIKHLQKLLKEGGDAILSEHQLSFDDHQVNISRQGQSSAIEWSSFQDFVLTEDRVYLKLGPLNGLIVPRTVAGAEEFVRACQTHITHHENITT
ncbi:MAG: YcxB family protein [Planctomycetes bacterium]|nr:YcxB family protein [Planctomycetota bacterium]